MGMPILDFLNSFWSYVAGPSSYWVVAPKNARAMLLKQRNGIGKRTSNVRNRQIEMALTREFKETVLERAKNDPEFRVGLLTEAAECLLNDEADIAKT